MPARVRNILIWVLVAFALYAIVTSPHETANAITGIWEVISRAVKNIGAFFGSLMS